MPGGATQIVNIPGWDLNPGPPVSRGGVVNCPAILSPPQDDTKVRLEVPEGHIIIIHFFSSFSFIFIFNHGKIHTIKFTIVTIFRCMVQLCCVHVVVQSISRTLFIL